MMINKRPGDDVKPTRTPRERAEEMVTTTCMDIAGMPAEDIQKIIHELQVHQMELEIQNEDLRGAQIELGHARDRYADLYAFAPVGYVTLDRHGVIQEANLTVADMLEVERQHVVGRQLSDYLVDDAQEAWHLHRSSVFSQQTKQTCELLMKSIHGSSPTIRLESRAFADEKGELNQCRTALIDVTSERHAQQQLAATERRYHETLEQRVAEQTKEINLLATAISKLGEGVLITSDHLGWPGPHIIFVNDALCRITGYTAEELIGESPRILQGSDTDRATLDRIKTELSAGRSCLAELTNYRKDGARYDAELFITPLFNAAGHRTNFVSVHRDISQRKRAEHALRKSEEQLRAVLNTAADAIITIDEHGIITGVNPATVQMFGYSEYELIGQGVKILMPKPYSDEHDSYIARYLATGQARIIGSGREVVGQRKDGAIFPISLAITQVDHLGLFTGIVRDMSERKKLQRDVLSIADSEQRRIGQDLHDSTQQELAGLGMLMQTLLNNLEKAPAERPQAESPDFSQLAKRILDGIVRAHKEVQTISRGLVPIRFEKDGFLDALRELACRTDDLEGITCALKCEQPVEIADGLTATNLYRIAQEAVTNALKHGRPEHILITLESDNGQPVIQIADDGTGYDSTGQSEGMGLKTMRYRANLIGAKLTVSPVETGGTLVSCHVFGGGGNLR